VQGEDGILTVLETAPLNLWGTKLGAREADLMVAAATRRARGRFDNLRARAVDLAPHPQGRDPRVLHQ